MKNLLLAAIVAIAFLGVLAGSNPVYAQAHYQTPAGLLPTIRPLYRGQLGFPAEPEPLSPFERGGAFRRQDQPPRPTWSNGAGGGAYSGMGGIGMSVAPLVR